MTDRERDSSIIISGRERDSSIMIIRHFLSAYTLSSLSQSCVCVYLYSCSLSRTPWLHSDIHTHTSKHWLALSLTMRTLLRKRGRWLHSGHTYTQTPLHCHPPVYISLSFAHLSLIEELRMRCTNIFHLYCHLQREAGGGRGGVYVCVCVGVRERQREKTIQTFHNNSSPPVHRNRN